MCIVKDSVVWKIYHIITLITKNDDGFRVKRKDRGYNHGVSQMQTKKEILQSSLSAVKFLDIGETVCLFIYYMVLGIESRVSYMQGIPKRARKIVQ